MRFKIIATKSDKIGKTRIFDRRTKIGEYFTIGRDSVIAVSSETGYGKDKVLEKIENIISIFNDDFYSADDSDEGDEE